MTNRFEKWFIAQYGKRPARETLQRLLEKREEYNSLYFQAKHDVDHMQRYIDRKDAAYKAWLAATEGKK